MFWREPHRLRLGVQGVQANQGRYETGSLPYATLVGNTKEPSWRDNIVGFTAFYHLLAKGMTIKDAVEGMKAAFWKSRL